MPFCAPLTSSLQMALYHHPKYPFKKNELQLSHQEQPDDQQGSCFLIQMASWARAVESNRERSQCYQHPAFSNIDQDGVSWKMGPNTYTSLLLASMKYLVTGTVADGTLRLDRSWVWPWETTEKPYKRPVRVQNFTQRAAVSVLGWMQQNLQIPFPQSRMVFLLLSLWLSYIQ